MCEICSTCVFVVRQGENDGFLRLVPNVFTAHTNTRCQIQKGKWESKKMSGGNEGCEEGGEGGMAVIL